MPQNIFVQYSAFCSKLEFESLQEFQLGKTYVTARPGVIYFLHQTVYQGYNISMIDNLSWKCRARSLTSVFWHRNHQYTSTNFDRKYTCTIFDLIKSSYLPVAAVLRQSGLTPVLCTGYSLSSWLERAFSRSE